MMKLNQYEKQIIDGEFAYTTTNSGMVLGAIFDEGTQRWLPFRLFDDGRVDSWDEGFIQPDSAMQIAKFRFT